jgi:hypothetical protein
VDPYPHESAFILFGSTRTRIRIGNALNADPDPGGKKTHQKQEISRFKVLEVLF